MNKFGQARFFKLAVLVLAGLCCLSSSRPALAHLAVLEDGNASKSDGAIDWYDHGYLSGVTAYNDPQAGRGTAQSCSELDLRWDSGLTESQNRESIVQKILAAVSPAEINYSGSGLSFFTNREADFSKKAMCAISLAAQMMNFHQAPFGGGGNGHQSAWTYVAGNSSFNFVDLALCDTWQSNNTCVPGREGTWVNFMRNYASLERRTITYHEYNWTTYFNSAPIGTFAGTVHDVVYVPFGADILGSNSGTNGIFRTYSFPTLVLRYNGAAGARDAQPFEILESLSLAASSYGGAPQGVGMAQYGSWYQYFMENWNIDTTYTKVGDPAYCQATFNASRQTYVIPFGCTFRINVDASIRSGSNPNTAMSFAFGIGPVDSPMNTSIMNGDVLRGPYTYAAAVAAGFIGAASDYFNFTGSCSSGVSGCHSMYQDNTYGNLDWPRLNPHYIDLTIANRSDTITPAGEPRCFRARFTSSMGPSYLIYSYVPTMEGPRPLCLDIVDPGTTPPPTDGAWVYSPTAQRNSPITAKAGDTVSITGYTTNTGVASGPGYTQVVQAKDSSDVTGTSSYSTNFSGGLSPGQEGSHQTVTFTISSNTPVGEQVCFETVTSPAAGTNTGGVIAVTDDEATSEEVCVTIVDSPYLKVYGNDIWSGGAYELGSGCSVPPSGADVTKFGRIYSYVDVTSNVGAAAQFAAFAWGNIDAFGTAEVPTSTALAFANFGVANPGNFGAERCLSGLFDDDTNGHASGQIDDLLWDNSIDSSDIISVINSDSVSNQFRYDGNQTINNSTVKLPVTVVVKGDVTITNDVVSHASFYGTATAPTVPILVLIASGNITIEDDVTQLDGIFIAQGTIDTCDGTQPLTIDVCDEPLEINGSFIANRIAFRRTAGSLTGAATSSGAYTSRCDYLPQPPPSNFRSPTFSFPDNLDTQCAAEIFRFSPEIYLANPIFRRGTSSELPVQQLRDLPPLF